jgi:hypothetical protein
MNQHKNRKHDLTAFNIGELYENLSHPLHVHLEWIILPTALHKIINTSLPL